MICDGQMDGPRNAACNVSPSIKPPLRGTAVVRKEGRSSNTPCSSNPINTRPDYKYQITSYPRITTVPHYLYKPLLLRVRESAVYSLLSPTTQTPNVVPSQKPFSLVCTSDLVRPIL